MSTFVGDHSLEVRALSAIDESSSDVERRIDKSENKGLRFLDRQHAKSRGSVFRRSRVELVTRDLTQDNSIASTSSNGEKAKNDEDSEGDQRQRRPRRHMMVGADMWM